MIEREYRWLVEKEQINFQIGNQEGMAGICSAK